MVPPATDINLNGERADQDLGSWLEPSNRYREFYSDGSSNQQNVHQAISPIEDLSDLRLARTHFSSYNQGKSCPAGYMAVKAVQLG